jgi:hypothetical protein
MPPYLLEKVIGCTLTQALQPDDPIRPDILAQGPTK